MAVYSPPWKHDGEYATAESSVDKEDFLITVDADEPFNPVGFKASTDQTSHDGAS